MRVLVTGGAGYVGSHCARALEHAGNEVVVFDNLSSGYRNAVRGELIVGDIRDHAALMRVLERGFDAVMHFAALLSVAESVSKPLAYFDVNVRGTLTLLDAMKRSGCTQLVFSSTCAVYGLPDEVPIRDSNPFGPINPYGETKATVERVLELARQSGDIRSMCLRYFNAAGASEDGQLGEAHDPEPHLIPIALSAAENSRPMSIFGSDYATPDGTCVRDYVHVLDLAAAHVGALEHLQAGEVGCAVNLGTGQGYSVAEILNAIERVTGLTVERVLADRRAGDPPMLVAHTQRAQELLQWTATRDLDQIIHSAWHWHLNPKFGPRSSSGHA